LTEAEMRLESCVVCGGALAARAEGASPPVPAPAPENRRTALIYGVAIGAAAALLLPLAAILVWHWTVWAQRGTPDAATAQGQAQAPVPVTPKIAEPEPAPVQHAPVAPPQILGGERAEVVYPALELARAKTEGDGITDSDIAARAKPAAAQEPAPRVADERPAPPANLNLQDALPRLGGLPDRQFGGMFGAPGQGNPLDQLFKAMAARDQELEKLFNAAGMQDNDLLGAVRAIQGFGKLPAGPMLRPNAPRIEPPPREGAGEVDEITLTGDSISDKHLASLRGHRGLRVLSIARTNVTDAGMVYLKDLKSLRRLYLEGTGVTDKGIEHLFGLTELRELDLANTRVTDAGIQRLRQALPDVKITR